MDKLDTNKLVDIFYDFLDKACMAIYDDIHLDYLESFLIVSNAITKITTDDVDIMDPSFYDKRLSNKCVKKLSKIYTDLEEYEFSSEVVRLATELILIKGFKARNLLLDFVTPDTINYLFSYIINSIIRYNKEYSDMDNIRILDTVLGTGNLVQTIINNSNALRVDSIKMWQFVHILHILISTKHIIVKSVSVVSSGKTTESQFKFICK